MSRSFGEILADHENRQAKKNKKAKQKKADINQLMQSWIDKNGIPDKDATVPTEEKYTAVNPSKIKPNITVDLHGMTAEQAERSLELLFDEAVEKNYKKVLIIHGKGNHSKSEPVLKKLVQEFIEKNPNAGRSGTEKAANGGSGATWVMIKGAS